MKTHRKCSSLLKSPSNDLDGDCKDMNSCLTAISVYFLLVDILEFSSVLPQVCSVAKPQIIIASASDLAADKAWYVVLYDSKSEFTSFLHS